MYIAVESFQIPIINKIVKLSSVKECCYFRYLSSKLYLKTLISVSKVPFFI